MKKLLIITALTTSLAGLTAFGQGYVQFTTAKSQVWDQLDDGGTATLTTNINTAFLWAANGSVPVAASIYGSSPVTGFPIYTMSSAWTAILTDPNFTLAVNNNNSLMAIQRTTATGAINYNAGAAFPVAGMSAGITYNLFIIGWDGAYATPVLASAANAGVGWSAPFNYTARAFTEVPDSMLGLTPAFGVWGVPEPSTLALAGLGALSLWLVRRRK